MAIPVIDLERYRVQHVDVLPLHVESAQSASGIWREIFSHHPNIAVVSEKTYPYLAHGLPNPGLPFYYVSSAPILHSVNPNEAGAVGSFVGMDHPDEETLEMPVWAFDYGIDDFTVVKTWLKTFAFFDFEYPATNFVLDSILSTLQELSATPWYLLNSGGSYHLILDQLFDIRKLPIIWGNIMLLFAENAIYNKQLMMGIGNELIERYGNLERLERLIETIRTVFGHIDDKPFQKEVGILDMKYIANCIGKFCYFFRKVYRDAMKPGMELGFEDVTSYLRYIAHAIHHGVPHLKAKSDGMQTYLYVEKNTKLSTQPSLL